MFSIKRFTVLLLVASIFVCCKKNEGTPAEEETILKGKASIYVDESVMPIVEDQVMVFESKYEAKFKLIPKSEAEILNSLFKGEAKIAVLARNLSKDELKVFEQKRIVPKITKFAFDGIAFVSNKSFGDTLIELKDVVDFIKGSRTSKIKGLVFDNPNSSTVSFMDSIAQSKLLSSKDVFSMKTNNDVLKFVAENEGMIGVVGVNWLSQPMPNMKEVIKKLNVMSVKALDKEGYFSPSQNDFSEGSYPLLRGVYIVNCQGISGLGMGFASFAAGDIGQRIVLKSGLLPNKVPTRRINIIHGPLNKE